MTSLAFAQTPSQPAGERDQPQPSKQQALTQAPTPKPSSQDPSQPELTTKEQENVQHEIETGTSRDRLFWTMPNFLTLENADRVPALTSAQKYKVVGRSLIDPFEFVLIGFVAGLGQASNTNPTYGQGASGYERDTRLLTRTTQSKTSWPVQSCHHCSIRIRGTTN